MPIWASVHPSFSTPSPLCCRPSLKLFVLSSFFHLFLLSSDIFLLWNSDLGSTTLNLPYYFPYPRQLREPTWVYLILLFEFCVPSYFFPSHSICLSSILYVPDNLGLARGLGLGTKIKQPIRVRGGD